MGVDHPNKNRYFELIAEKFDLDVDVIKRIAEGESAGQKHSLISAVLDEFIKTSDDEMIFAMVWQGTPDTAFSNLPRYDWAGQVMEGLNLKLFKTGFTAQLFPINSIIADQAYYERLLSKRPGAGFIILHPDNMKDIQALCNNKQIPYVVLAALSNTDLEQIYMVRIDDKALIRANVKFLYEMGHRRIAFITGRLLHNAAGKRLQGYYEGLKDTGIPLNEDWIVEGNWHEEGGYAATHHFLGLDERPTAIVASNDLMAIGAIKCIQGAGLNVPDDISVMGCDDIADAMKDSPTLTTVHVPMTHLGRKAGEYMISLLNGESPEPRQYYAETRIVPRESTAPPARI